MATITVTQAAKIFAVSNMALECVLVSSRRFTTQENSWKPKDGNEIDDGFRAAADTDDTYSALEDERRHFEKSIRSKKEGSYWRKQIKSEYGHEIV